LWPISSEGGGMKIYLAGPIMNCTHEEIHEWREYVKNQLPGFEFYDPSQFEEGLDSTKTVEEDKRLIDESDVVLVNLFKLGIGTIMEIFYAWTWGKNILVVTKDYKDNCWLKYHTSFVFEDLDSALQLLKKEKL
jgi:nucleoside 2-deoxyribosyltransferase